MSVHFETEDYKNRKIICAEDVWLYHILDEHEEMENEEENIKNTLSSPQYGHAFIDKNFANRRTYYKRIEKEDYFLKVVAQFENDDANGNGTLVTAYFTDQIKSGERPEWPTKKS